MKDTNKISSRALGQMLTNAHDKIYRHLLFKTFHNEKLAQDICSQAFERIINTVNKGEYKEEDKFTSWAMIIAKNILTDHFRAESRTVNVCDKGPISFEEFIKYKKIDERDYEEYHYEIIDTDSEITKELKNQISKLSKEQAQIINLVFFRGYHYKDIAKDYKMSINTALGRMRYALKALRKINEQDPTLRDLAQNNNR